MIIRLATLEDAAAIAEVHLFARREAYRDFFPAEFLQGLTLEFVAALWRERLTAPCSTCLITNLDGRVVAQVRFGAAEIVDEPVGEIYQLHVHPEFWRRAIGSALLREALARLAADGFAEAVLNVYEDNANGRAFYEHEGWRADGGYEDAERGGVMLRQLRYRRSTAI